MSIQPVVIIGAGPAGLAAAIQLKRFGIDALIFEMDSVGGLLRNANLVENYPGFPGGIRGVALIQLFEEQASTIGISITPEQVMSLDHDGKRFQVQTEAQTINAQIVVVATGTYPNQFRDFTIPMAAQNKVFYEVYHLLEQTGKQVAIVGAGDAAFDYGLNLANRGNEVLILNRSTELKCLPLLWERAQKISSIQYYQETSIQEISASQEKLTLVCGSMSLQVDYLLGAIGRQPRLETVSPRVQEHAQRLENQGLLYFVGDVKNGIYRQTSIAIGDGIKAAMQICQHKEFAA